MGPSPVEYRRMGGDNGALRRLYHSVRHQVQRQDFFRISLRPAESVVDHQNGVILVRVDGVDRSGPDGSVGRLIGRTHVTARGEGLESFLRSVPPAETAAIERRVVLVPIEAQRAFG